MDYRIEKFDKYIDSRGDLIVFLRNSDLDKKYHKFGQIYFVKFDKKNSVRGNHYHNKIREWFGIIDGKLDVFLKDIKTNEEKHLILDSKDKKYIRLEIGPGIAHAFKNSYGKASLVNYTDYEWTKEDTIQYKLF